MKAWKRVVAGTVLAGAVLGLGAQAASAATASSSSNAAAATRAGSCTTSVQEQWIGSTFEYRVAARCTQIDPGVKARGVLDAPLWPDAHTPWFTTTDHTYYSDWKVSPAAKPKSRMEFAQA